MTENKWIADKVARIPATELADWNIHINTRLAADLGDEPGPPTIAPISAHVPTWANTLGTGEREFEGLSTGLPDFDHLIGGLNKFVLLAARAGTGKSTLAIQLALGTLFTENTPILYYSFEMPKTDVYTMLLQNLTHELPYHLTRNEIVLRGRATDNADRVATMTEAMTALSEISSRIYVVDAADGRPDSNRIESDIQQILDAHNALPLVIIDSIQDLLAVGAAGATTAEAEMAQQILEIQQVTGATILAISQKSKGAAIDDPYAAVLGSVSLIHKPTAVIELVGVFDLIRGLGVKNADLSRIFRKLADDSAMPRPVIARVIKGRHNGSGHLSLKHYGRYGYFEVGRIHDYDANTEGSLYDLNAFTN